MTFIDIIPRPLYAGNHDIYCGDDRFYAGYSGALTEWTDVSAASPDWTDASAPSTTWTDV